MNQASLPLRCVVHWSANNAGIIRTSLIMPPYISILHATRHLATTLVTRNHMLVESFHCRAVSKVMALVMRTYRSMMQEQQPPLFLEAVHRIIVDRTMLGGAGRMRMRLFLHIDQRRPFLLVFNILQYRRGRFRAHGDGHGEHLCSCGMALSYKSPNAEQINRRNLASFVRASTSSERTKFWRQIAVSVQ